MKKNLLLIVLLFASIISLQAQSYQKPKLSDSNSWSLIILPDVQNYVKFERNQPILDLMTTWIKVNLDTLNIKMVMCTGDLVEYNERIDPDGTKFDQPSKSQWEAVSRSFSKLDGHVPYLTVTGNHDFSYGNQQKKNSHFNEYFPVDKNFLNQKLLKTAGWNTEVIQTLENAAFEFTSPNNEQYLFLTMEFGPRDDIIEWARKVVDDEKYKKHRVVILTHSYLAADNERIKESKYPVADKNEGEAIWQKLIQPSNNIEFVVSGHIGLPDNFEGHTGFRTDKNNAGKKVHQMAFNAQGMGGGWAGNGGDGWLRILEFLPDGKTVKVKTFSPLFAFSPSTQSLAWEKSDYNEFEFQFGE